MDRLFPEGPKRFQEIRGSAGHEFIIEYPHIQQVFVVSDNVTRTAIDGAKQKNSIVSINRVVSQVEEADSDRFGKEKEPRDECFDLGRAISFFEQLLRVFRSDIAGDQPDEFARGQGFRVRLCKSLISY